MAQSPVYQCDMGAERRSLSGYWLWSGDNQLSFGHEPPAPYVPPQCRQIDACRRGAEMLHRHGQYYNSTYHGIFVPGFLGGYHGYYNETEIGRATPSLSAQIVFQELLHQPAPGPRAAEPVRSNQHTRIPLLGLVRHMVVPAELLILNITEEDHRLHPGTVARFVFNRGGTLHIGTFGVGMGILPVLNGTAAPEAWRNLDVGIAARLCR